MLKYVDTIVGSSAGKMKCIRIRLRTIFTLNSFEVSPFKFSGTYKPYHHRNISVQKLPEICT